MSWVDFWPGRYELPKKLASLEQDEIGPQASGIARIASNPAEGCAKT